MTRADNTVLLEALARDARTLRGEEDVPVDLEKIAKRLGLKIEWGVERIHPAEGALLHGSAGWTVAVADADLYRPRSRFTAAHEIGHYLLESYGLPRPAGRGEYWRTELLCHHFAGHLLVPDVGVEWVGKGAGGGPAELLRRSAILSRRALVSPQALSHRLNQDLPFCAFCEIKFESPRREVVGVVNWLVERFSWLGLRARKHVKSDHYLARILARSRPLRPDQVSADFLNGLPLATLRRFQSVWLLGVEPALATSAWREPGQLPLPLDALPADSTTLADLP